MLLLLPAGCIGSAVGVRAPPPLVRVAGGVVCSLFPSWQTFPPPLVDSQPKRVTFYTSAGDFKVDVDRGERRALSLSPSPSPSSSPSRVPSHPNPLTPSPAHPHPGHSITIILTCSPSYSPINPLTFSHAFIACAPSCAPLGRPTRSFTLSPFLLPVTISPSSPTPARMLIAANSPAGVDRLLQLVNEGFFSGQLLYRVIPGFLIQFGVAADPEVMSRWDAQKLPDEPNRAPFRRGTLSFAGNGADSRSCHLFIALEPHGKRLGKASHETTLGWVDDNDLYVSHMHLSPMPVALWLSLHTDIRCSHPHEELLEKLRSLLLTHFTLHVFTRCWNR